MGYVTSARLRRRPSRHLYYGAEDAADPTAVETAKALGVEMNILSGRHDHFEAFSDAESVAPMVLSFLDQFYRS